MCVCVCGKIEFVFQLFFKYFPERFSDKDLLAAQNTILYHLSNCSEYKISEKEMVQQIRVIILWST